MSTQVPLPTPMQLIDQMGELGHRVFTGAWNPNLIGIRNRNREADEWDDLLCLLYQDDRGIWQLHPYQGTTDPGLAWLRGDEGHPAGTAIVIPGQYRGCWQFGPTCLHRGKYPAFLQVREMDFVRDANRDQILDIEALVAAGKTERGLRGFNGHRASAHSAVSSVGWYSAGCQVWRLAGDFCHVLDFCNWSAQWYGNHISYTLLDQWM